MGKPLSVCQDNTSGASEKSHTQINPLIVDEKGAIAVDPRIVVGNVSPTARPYDQMAIHPYPSQLIQVWALPGGRRIEIRPIRPEDADIEAEFVRKLSAKTKLFRFMSTLGELAASELARLTQIDYDREMAFIATMLEGGHKVEIGVCRYSVNADQESCEFAVVIADDWQGRGLGRKLMSVLIESARDRGLKYMSGMFLSKNEGMLRFVQDLGFVLSKDPRGKDPHAWRSNASDLTLRTCIVQLFARHRSHPLAVARVEHLSKPQEAMDHPITCCAEWRRRRTHGSAKQRVHVSEEI